MKKGLILILICLSSVTYSQVDYARLEKIRERRLAAKVVGAVAACALFNVPAVPVVLVLAVSELANPVSQYIERRKRRRATGSNIY